MLLRTFTYLQLVVRICQLLFLAAFFIAVIIVALLCGGRLPLLIVFTLFTLLALLSLLFFKLSMLSVSWWQSLA